MMHYLVVDVWIVHLLYEIKTILKVQKLYDMYVRISMNIMH